MKTKLLRKLAAFRKRYEINFQNMLRTDGTKEHKIYTDKEKILHTENKRLLKKLGTHYFIKGYDTKFWKGGYKKIKAGEDLLLTRR
jgi:hypothetical protein